MNVPKYLWGDALLHATYLINRMPSKILNFKTPINILHQLYPQSRLFHSLPLYIFGCTVFIRNPDKHASKLDPKGTRCVFLGLANNKKGYKCFVPSTRKIFITMDVLFFENRPFFEYHRQGETLNTNDLGREIESPLN